MSSFPVEWNLGPLYSVRSRKSTDSMDCVEVNLTVDIWLFSFIA